MGNATVQPSMPDLGLSGSDLQVFWHGVPFLSVKCRFKHLRDVFLVQSFMMFSSKLDWCLACLMGFF